MPLCANCLQQIRQGTPYDVTGPTQAHRFASDCIRAVLARCIEIAGNGELTGIGIEREIRRAFPGRV